MDSRRPLVGESGSTRASRFRNKLDGISSALTSVKDFIQFGQRLTVLEPLPSHLQIGKVVEIIEDNECTFVEATIKDISYSDGMILVKTNCNESEHKFISLPKDKVRPGYSSSHDTEHDGKGRHPSFMTYAVVDVLIDDKWMKGAIIQSPPAASEDRYLVRIFRGEEKSDFTVAVTTKMRLSFDWDKSRGWNYQLTELINHPLNQSVGLIGRQRSKIIKMLDTNHALVEFSDLTHSDGTHLHEVVHIKDWHQSRWARWLKKLRDWLAPSNDPVREFECYMPVYICLAMLAAVSQVLPTLLRIGLTTCCSSSMCLVDSAVFCLYCSLLE